MHLRRLFNMSEEERDRFYFDAMRDEYPVIILSLCSLMAVLSDVEFAANENSFNTTLLSQYGIPNDVISGCIRHLRKIRADYNVRVRDGVSPSIINQISTDVNNDGNQTKMN